MSKKKEVTRNKLTAAMQDIRNGYNSKKALKKKNGNSGAYFRGQGGAGISHKSGEGLS